MIKTIQGFIQTMNLEVPGAIALALKIVICIVIFLIGRRMIRWLVKTLRGTMERAGIQKGAVTFTVSAVKISLYTILALGIAMQFGLKESTVAAVIASGGVAIGLALQGGLSNFIGGFLILIFQPFQVGDYVIAQGQEGSVYKIEILYTTLLTIDNRRVIIPNGNLANNVIVNVTGSSKRRLEIKVGISYQDNLEKAKAVMQKLIESDPDVLCEEEQIVFVSELAESSVNIGLRCWVNTDRYMSVLWRMNEQIKKGFDAEGISIAYPQLDVHVKQ